MFLHASTCQKWFNHENAAEIFSDMFLTCASKKLGKCFRTDKNFVINNNSRISQKLPSSLPDYFPSFGLAALDCPAFGLEASAAAEILDPELIRDRLQLPADEEDFLHSGLGEDLHFAAAANNRGHPSADSVPFLPPASDSCRTIPKLG